MNKSFHIPYKSTVKTSFKMLPGRKPKIREFTFVNS